MWESVRVRLFWPPNGRLLGALLVAALPVLPGLAKTPGEVHCYRLICHRVKTIDETYRLVGTVLTLVTSYYDDPHVDRFNTGLLTSSGERFDANNPGRAASSIFPDGTQLLLWNPLNRRAAHVRINDFGPFHSNRTLDITRALAHYLDITRTGVIALRVTVIAAPRPGESTYRRLRKYAGARGYLGIYHEREMAQLAKTLSAVASTDAAPYPADLFHAAKRATQLLRPTPAEAISLIAPPPAGPSGALKSANGGRSPTEAANPVEIIPAANNQLLRPTPAEAIALIAPPSNGFLAAAESANGERLPKRVVEDNAPPQELPQQRPTEIASITPPPFLLLQDVQSAHRAPAIARVSGPITVSDDQRQNGITISIKDATVDVVLNELHRIYGFEVKGQIASKGEPLSKTMSGSLSSILKKLLRNWDYVIVHSPDNEGGVKTVVVSRALKSS